MINISTFFKIICGFCIAILLMFNSAFPQNNHLLVLGDSLSAAYNMPNDKGWVELYAQELKGNDWSVINASISGDTLSNSLTRLPELLKVHTPKAIIIELGANDGLQGKPLSTITESLTRIIELAKAHKVTHIFLIEMTLPQNYGAAYITPFTDLYQTIAMDQNITLIPLLEANILGNPEWIQADGLHPNEKAQPLIKKVIMQATRSILTH